jgi:hypothetical protein
VTQAIVRSSSRSGCKQKLAKTPKPSQSDEAKLTDCRVFRPFTPSFDPALTSTCLSGVRRFCRELELVDPAVRLPKCEPLQLATQKAAEKLPKRKKASAGWCMARARTLDPLRLHRSALLKKWNQRGRSGSKRLETAKRAAVEAMNVARRGCFNALVQSEMGRADNSFGGARSKSAWDTVKQVPSCGKPKKVHKSPLRTPSGEKTRSDLERLGVVKKHPGKLFQKPP